MGKSDIGLDEEEEQALIRNGVIVNYEKGDMIFSARQAGNRITLHSKWLGEHFKINDQGRQVSLGLRYSGEFAGLGSFACNHERGCYGQAMMDSKIVIISREKFDLLLDELPCLSSKLICLLGTRLKDTQNSIVYCISHQTEKRLIVTLLNIARYLGRESHGKRLINLKLSQEELANLIGCSRQTVNNLLMELKADGCMEMKGREIVAISRTSWRTKFRRRDSTGRASLKIFIWIHDRTFHSWSMMNEPSLHEAMYSRASAAVLAATEEEAIQLLVERNEGWREEDLSRLKPKVIELDQKVVLYSHIV